MDRVIIDGAGCPCGSVPSLEQFSEPEKYKPLGFKPFYLKTAFRNNDIFYCYVEKLLLVLSGCL